MVSKTTEPFDGWLEVPVAGGALNVAYAGPPPPEAEAVVLAVHGVTASHVAWRTVARQLAGRTGACLLAPDLRGRGRSAALPRPYGLVSHVEDLTGALDHLGVERAVMAGHSMGAHLAFECAWDDDVEAYARHDMADDGGRARCVVSEEAVMADSFDLLFDGVTRAALTRVRAPIRLLRAPRGPLDDDCPVIPHDYLDDFAAEHPHVEVENVPDTNHYTLVLGNSPGPARVAAAIECAIRDSEDSCGT